MGGNKSKYIDIAPNKRKKSDGNVNVENPTYTLTKSALDELAKKEPFTFMKLVNTMDFPDRGDIAILKAQVEDNISGWNVSGIDMLIEAGDIDGLKYKSEKGGLDLTEPYFIGKALRHSQLQLAEWLFRQGAPLYPIEVICEAIRSEDFNVYSYLIEKYIDIGVLQVMRSAAINGNLYYFRYLMRSRPSSVENLSSDFMVDAIFSGNNSLVYFFHEKGSIINTEVVKAVFKSGNTELYKWLDDQSLLEWFSSSSSSSCKRKSSLPQKVDEMVSSAVEGGHIIITNLLEQKGYNFKGKNTLMKVAFENCKYEMVSWLEERKCNCGTQEMLDIAISKKDFFLVFKSYYNGAPLFTMNNMLNIMKTRDARIIDWLVKEIQDKKDKKELDEEQLIDIETSGILNSN